MCMHAARCSALPFRRLADCPAAARPWVCHPSTCKRRTAVILGRSSLMAHLCPHLMRPSLACTLLFAQCLLAILQGAALAKVRSVQSSCKRRDEQPVDWWIALKAAGSGSTGSGAYAYLDPLSRSEADTIQAVQRRIQQSSRQKAMQLIYDSLRLTLAPWTGALHQ